MQAVEHYKKAYHLFTGEPDVQLLILMRINALELEARGIKLEVLWN